MWRRPNLIVNAALGALVLGGAVLAYQTVSKAGSTTPTASTSQNVTVSTGTVTATVSASGTVQSATTASADFVTSGTVTEIDVQVGQTVTKGQVLAKVDPTSVQQQLNTARANLTAAEDALSRAEAASSPDAATIASDEAAVTQAQATVDSDQRAVDGTVLKAPMAGTVTAVNGTVGASSSSTSGSSSGSGSTGSGSTGGGSTGGGSTSNRTSGGGTSGGGTSGGGTSGGGGSSSSSSSNSSGSSSGFIQIADLTQMQVSGYFSEADTTKLKTGQSATVTWNALSGTKVTGKVASISPTATTQNSVNSYGVLVGLDSLPSGIKIGQTTTITVTVAEADNVVRVPTAAVRAAGRSYSVQVVSAKGATQTTLIEVGVAGDTYYEVTSGLTAGQTVTITRSVSTSSSSGTNRFPGGGVTGGLGGLTGGGPAGGGAGGGR